MVIEDETPMFSKQKVNFAPPERITHMCVSSELIVLAMANGILLRIDLKQPDKPEGEFFYKFSLTILYKVVAYKKFFLNNWEQIGHYFLSLELKSLKIGLHRSKD